jgi:hypothetical protein
VSNQPRYKLRVLEGVRRVDREDDNVDVEVEFEDGSKYAATFFSVRNLQSLLDRYAETGDCLNGLYVWSKNMIILRELTRQHIALTVSDLVNTGEFANAFEKI